MSPTTRFRALLIASSLVYAGCSASADNAPDPVTDAGADTATDAPDDTSTDTAVPDTAVPDTGSDVETDTSSDADASTCGDKIVDPGEECDDGNLVAGDGCSPSCKIETTGEEDACPGKAIALSGTGTLLTGSVTGTTSGALHHYAHTCGGGSGKDVVYTVTSAVDGKATVTLKADYAAILAVRNDCTVSSTEIACAEAVAPAYEKTITFPVLKDKPVALMLDGYAGATGTFTLDVEVSLATCGDGIAQAPEACDDGNTVDGDGCSSTCALESGGVIDRCPGQPFALKGTGTEPRKLSLAGDTSEATADSQGASGCYFSGATNFVYAIHADVTGSLRADLVASYPSANLHLRSECSSNTYQTFCDQRAPAAAPIRAEVPVKAGEWVYVFVDGDRDGSTEYRGPFTLDLTLTPGACGNHALDGGEECDDGNTTAGDGCDASCKLEAPVDVAALDKCPGLPLELTGSGTAPRNARISGSTAWPELANDFKLCGYSASGPDVVYAVTPDITGWLSATLHGNFTTILGVRTKCAEPASGGTVFEDYLACSNDLHPSETPLRLDGLGYKPKSVGLAVEAGTTYYLIVDAWSGSGGSSRGTFELDVTVSPSVCGNGVVEGGEKCDDGGTAPGDGCDATCQLEPVVADKCDDAVEIALTESSGTWSGTKVAGNVNLNADVKYTGCAMEGKDAVYKVLAPMTGVLRARITSTSYDVSLAAREACAAMGAALACVDASGVGGPEEIAIAVEEGKYYHLIVDSPDPAAIGTFTLAVSVGPSGCGDAIQSGGEQCDDGNTTPGDGCSATCTVETLTGIDDCPGYPVTLAASGTARTATLSVDTRSLAGQHSGYCGGNAGEGVLAVTPDISGTLTATIVTSTYDSTIYARATCNDPTTEFRKTTASTCPSVDHKTVRTPATAGTPVYLFVDGLDGAKGVAQVKITITP